MQRHCIHESIQQHKTTKKEGKQKKSATAIFLHTTMSRNWVNLMDEHFELQIRTLFFGGQDLGELLMELCFCHAAVQVFLQGLGIVCKISMLRELALDFCRFEEGSWRRRLHKRGRRHRGVWIASSCPCSTLVRHYCPVSRSLALMSKETAQMRHESAGQEAQTGTDWSANSFPYLIDANC